jgi:pimeloyl-ACP methyl ester carboxylesterase
MSHILLLHGAIGSSSQMLPLGNLIDGKLSVAALDFTGHAGRNAETSEFSIPQFADDVLAWMEENKLGTINIFGYSMGGYVALYLARHYPEKVNRVFTLATKFRWTPEIALQEIKMLDPETIEEKVPLFARTKRASQNRVDDDTDGNFERVEGRGFQIYPSQSDGINRRPRQDGKSRRDCRSIYIASKRLVIGFTRYGPSHRAGEFENTFSVYSQFFWLINVFIGERGL